MNKIMALQYTLHSLHSHYISLR